MKSFLLFTLFLGYSIAAVIPVSTQNTAKNSNSIRQCTCEESDACILEAYTQFLFCRLSCQSNLEYFGSLTAQYVTCFPTPNPTGAEMINTCLHSHIEGFCATDNSTFIETPNYNSDVSATFEDDPEMVKHLKSFHTCAGACLKKHILACYDRKACGVYLPSGHDIGKVGLFCPSLKSHVTANTIKAVPCFTLRNIYAKLWKN